MKIYEINEKQLNTVANYMGTKPYNESAPIINILAQLPEARPALKEVKEESE